jgi:hypothetical protein
MANAGSLSGTASHLSLSQTGKLSLNELYDRKFHTISEEIVLNEKMNNMIKTGGLSKSSTLAMENVKEAIALTKKPFYTEVKSSYHEVNHYFVRMFTIPIGHS